MSNFAERRSWQPVPGVAAGQATRGLAESAWPWIIGFCGVLTMFLYRETLRLTMWARSWSW
jgi:hypothetical protein